jgi:pilus assembly protein CpaB
MQRRLIAALVAIVLAGVGAILLFNYVSGADARAMSGIETTKVLVVTTQVSAGTLGSALGSSVQLRDLPKVAVVSGALTSTDTIKDLAAVANLEVGQQLVPSLFAKPGTSATGDVVIPNNMQQVSLQLDSQRVVGNSLTAGSKIAIYVTITTDTSVTTQQILNDVLVTKVGGTDSGTVTVALEPKNVQRLVLALESQKVWIAEDAVDRSTTSPISVKQIFG